MNLEDLDPVSDEGSNIQMIKKILILLFSSVSELAIFFTEWVVELIQVVY